MKPEIAIIIFIQTCIILYLSLIYSFFVGKLFSPGKIRFVFILPVVCLLPLLPLRMNSINLIGSTTLFIAWVTPFKLILFSFNKGPLSLPSISLYQFVVAASLPIEITPKSKLDENPVAKSSSGALLWKDCAVKAAMMAVIFKLFDFRAQLHPVALMLLFAFHTYFGIEFLLTLAGVTAKGLLGGLELEPHFSNPLKSSSLKNFWGRRWNLIVGNVLRLTIHQPVMSLLTGSLGRNKARQISILTTFGVSGIMHELNMYYMIRMYPSGKQMILFLLQGIFILLEMAFVGRYKDKIKMKVSRIVSSGLTNLFVMITAFWLLYPEFERGKVYDRSTQENEAIGEFMNGVINGTFFRSFTGKAMIPYFFEQVASF